MKNNSKIFNILFFVIILFLGACLRLYGVNWDQNQHLHPDERFLTMVTGAITWPSSFKEYFDTNISPLNPHNKSFPFFVYGTFPLFFTKYIAEIANSMDYNGVTILGRKLSALFDLGTVSLVFLIARKLIAKKSNNSFVPHLAMLFYAISVMPIQLSHFYAVDTYLTFFLTLSFYLLIKLLFYTSHLLLITSLLGISFGLAIASKISAIYFSPIIGFGLLYFLIKNRKIVQFFVICCLLFVVCYLTVRLSYPYLFANAGITLSLNPKILDNWEQLKSFDDKEGGFPPAVQWITTKAYLFPLKNLISWGLGLPLGLLSVLAVLYTTFSIINLAVKRKISQILDPRFFILFLSLLWIILIFAYQGKQFVKAMRYFYPIYPFLAIVSSWFFFQILSLLKRNKKFSLLFVICYLLFVLIYPFSFITIYSKPHTRLSASEWIYNQIPKGSSIAGEHWDDFLPLSYTNNIAQNYKIIEFPLYHHDTEEKWNEMDSKLKNTDYIALSSNRLYGSIMTFPQKYPITNKYYRLLFNGSLGFEKVAEFTSRPNLQLPGIKICLTPPFVRYGIVAKESQECPLPGISFVDDYADETFTVYDHPKVIIFKKVKSVDYLDLLSL